MFFRGISKFLSLTFFVILLTSCYHPHPVETVKGQDKLQDKTIVIALDGIDYDLMHELQREGYFKDFGPVQPLVTTFPSGTTIGFTGIFQPLAVGTVQGYETRFYSFKDNKVMGGTPWDVYKFPIRYKYYFDYFRHKISEKSIMYAFPGVAGQYDLMNIREQALNNSKQLILAYLGGTDGSAHMLGRPRTKRFLKSMDSYLARIQREYKRKTGGHLRIVIFSDHGFHYGDLKSVTIGDIGKVLRKNGFRLAGKIQDDRDVLTVKYGLLSSGAFYTPKKFRAEIAAHIATVKGIDLVFWQMDQHRVYMRNSKNESAYFEYRGRDLYRYVTQSGDPLGYDSMLVANGKIKGQWLSDKDWQRISSQAFYPDAGRRLYDGFFQLVENPAAILISTHPDYDFGATITRIGTYLKFGQKGTHGGIFREPSLALAMVNDKKFVWPKNLRYDQFFPAVLPSVTRVYKSTRAREMIEPEYPK